MDSDRPHAQHIYQMLFRDIVLPIDVPLECRKDALSGQQTLPTRSLQIQQGCIGKAFFVCSWMCLIYLIGALNRFYRLVFPFRRYGEIL